MIVPLLCACPLLCSPVNDLLDRGDYTLSEIFDEDDLLQVRIMTICCEPLPYKSDHKAY